MSDKPRCKTCKHFVESSLRCEAGLPEVFVFAGKPTETGFADRSVTAWCEVHEDDGCEKHTAFSDWLKAAMRTTFDAGLAMRTIDPQGPYDCTCVRLRKPEHEEEVLILHEGRNLSAQSRCKICGGSGIRKTHDEMNDSRPTRGELFPMRADGGAYVLDDDGNVVMARR